MILSRASFAVVMVASALLSGAAGAFFVSQHYLFPRIQALQRSMTEYMDRVPSSPTPAVEVVRVEREPAAPIIPALFLQDRRSPLLSLVRLQGAEPELLTNERVIGSLISLTVDGWLLGPSTLFEEIRLSEVGVVSGGRLYPIREAIRDTATGLVYVKIAAQSASVVGFTPSQDVVAGLPVWTETAPQRFLPHVIVDVRERAVEGVVASEAITRRYVINASLLNMAKGSAVWNGAGQLVGVVEATDAMGAHVIPAAEAMKVLTPLLTTREIRHTTLGVAGVSASYLLSSDSSASSTSTVGIGFAVRGDRARAVPAVDPKGPAAKVLKDGDVLERLDRDILDGSLDLGERLAQYRPGTMLMLYGRRGNKRFEGSVTLGSVVTSEVLK
jgi:S1-C subfamily serine protease